MVERERDLQQQIDVLRRELARTRIIFTAVLGAGAAIAFLSAAAAAQDPRMLRARSLVIEDASGNDRIVMGAPILDPRPGRSSPTTGLVINDEKEIERFSVGLQASGRVVMGFDAPPGTGDPRNRERITIVTDDTGGAYIRFLNRKTLVPGRLILDDKDQFYLEFLDFQDGKTRTRRIGFTGDEVR
jgi:hypothetical protein